MAEQILAPDVIVTPGAAPILTRRAPQEKHLVVVPIDASGNVRLAPELSGRLGLPPTVSPASAGHYLAPGQQDTTLAYLVTLAEPNNVAETIRDNLRALFETYQQVSFTRTWLPLMGLEGGGLSREQSLDIILDALRESGVAGREDIRFVVATSPNIDISELVALRTKIESAVGRKPANIRQALSQTDIMADEETVSVLESAAYLALGQQPGLDNGRISTRVASLALLRRGRVQRLPAAEAFYEAWVTLAPQEPSRLPVKGEISDKGIGPYFRHFPEPGEIPPPPVIFSGRFIEALRMAAAIAADKPIALTHLIDALLDQASREPSTSARRVLDRAQINAAELRGLFYKLPLDPDDRARDPDG
jgi:hypothetical protein